MLWEIKPEDQTTLAIAKFEEGHERLRVGDLLGAELAWTRTPPAEPKFCQAAIPKGVALGQRT